LLSPIFLAFFSISSTNLSTALCSPLPSEKGFTHDLIYLNPSFDIASARTTVVVVPSQASLLVFSAASLVNSNLVKLRNDQIVNEKDQDSRTETTVENSGMEEEEIEMIKKENEKNQDLLILGKKYNEINLAYNQVLSNIKSMQEYEQTHPLDLKEDEKKNEEEEKEKEEKKGRKCRRKKRKC